MFLVGLEQVEIGMARALRVAFRHHHQFRWDPDPTLTKLTIYDEWPAALAALPRVIISASAPAMLAGHRGIGDEFATEDTTPISVNGRTHNQTTAEWRSGTNDVSVEVLVEARSKAECRQVADWCVLFLRSFAQDKFTREGLNVRDISAGPVTGVLAGADPIFSLPITVSCLTEFLRRIPISVQNTIDGMCVVGVFSMTSDGVTYGEAFLTANGTTAFM